MPTPAYDAIHAAVARKSPPAGLRQVSRAIREDAAKKVRTSVRTESASARAGGVGYPSSRYPRRYPPRSQPACEGENQGRGVGIIAQCGPARARRRSPQSFDFGPLEVVDAPAHEPITVQLVTGLVSTGNTTTGNSSAGCRVHGVSNGCSQMDVLPAPSCRRRGVGDLWSQLSLPPPIAGHRSTHVLNSGNCRKFVPVWMRRRYAVTYARFRARAEAHVGK